MPIKNKKKGRNEEISLGTYTLKLKIAGLISASSKFPLDS